MKFTALSSLPFALLLLYACSTSKFEETNEQALAFAANDQRIDQQEYETLVENIKNSDDRGFRLLKTESGEADHPKVAVYLRKYFDAKGVNVTDIWQPSAGTSAASSFNVSVFLENSASMDGYVDANSTAFKATMLDLLTNLDNFPGTDTLNLNYINSTIIPVKAAASKNEINDFYQNLNRTNFKTQGGKRGTSDIGAMLRQVLTRRKSGELSVLVSDFVFSPGGKNATNYLVGQRSEITSEFVAARQNDPDLALAILQAKAPFEGTYYDQNDTPHRQFSASRPYYVWLVGNAAHIKSLLDSKILIQTRNSYQNTLVVQAGGTAVQPPFKILYSPKIGQFDAKSLAQGTISGAQAARDDRNKGVFEFNVAVDFSKSMQNSAYFLDSTSYQLNDPSYSLKVAPITSQNDVSLRGFTHLLTLRTTDLKDEKLQINVVGSVPGWVYASSSENDTQIETDRQEANKTFGFSYLVEGVSDAFYPRSQPNSLYTIPLTIKK